MKTLEMTEKEIQEHPNWISSLIIDNVRIHILYNGNPLRYFMYWNGELLFEGDSFKPPCSYEYCSLDAMVDLIQWLTLSLDGGCDLIDDYNAEQIKWATSNDCCELNCLAIDYEEGEGDAKIMLNAGFYHC